MHTLHLISHTHWDREWHQTFQQFRLHLVHMIDGLLYILDNDPQYLHFMLDGQTIVLEDYLQIRPEREADLRKYVQNGRILIGPWYLMPDEFLVSPEAIIHNFLEGDRIARQFGPKMMVGYIPDTFGHIGQMPQILNGFGMHTASLWRGVQDQSNEFWWQAPDGSRVLMGFLRQGYGNASGALAKGSEGFIAAAKEQGDLLAPHTAGQDLLLMQGMDHQEAHPGTAAAIAYAAGKLDGYRMMHSTLPDYFAGVQANMELDKLAVVTGELRSPKIAPLLPGVLSARMWIKQRNQACETLLEKWADPFSAWAQAVAAGCADQVSPDAADYLYHPEAVLRQAWRLLLQCHPHDSICGCSIDQVHDEMRPRFDQSEQMADEITRQSLAALAGAINTRLPVSVDSTASAAPASAVVVFNPTTQPRTDLVSAVIEAPSESGDFDLLDESGAPVPFQSQGVGGSGQFEIHMDANMVKMSMNMIAPGQNIGFGKVLGLRVQREEIPGMGEALVEFMTGQAGEPDLVEWEQAVRQLRALADDPAVKSYHIVMRSGAASQVLFSAAEIPGLGYRTFWVRVKDRAAKPAVRISPLARLFMPLASRLAANPGAQKLLSRLQPDPAARPPYTIENEFLAVKAQPDGTLDVRDKRSGMLYRRQNRFVDGGDRGDTYNYSKPLTDPLVGARLKSVRVERDAVQQTLELHLEIDAPIGLAEDRKTRSSQMVALAVVSRVTLTAGVARVEVHTEIDNQARDHRLRVHFTAPFTVQAADYDGHFEVVRRPIDLPAFDAEWAEQPRPEAPQRAFTAAGDGTNGLLVANRGLPEVEVLKAEGGCEIAVTLLRCVGWLSRDDLAERRGPAGPGTATPGAQMPGKWAFDYAIVPFQESGRLQAYQQAYAFEAPLRAACTALHTGVLPGQGSFVQTDAPEFVVSTAKMAEDRRGWLVRGYNISSQPVTVIFKTMLKFTRVERVNLSEECLEPLPLSADNEITLAVKAHEVVTVLFNFKPCGQDDFAFR
jgi:mannosylglycerate hydrolase